MRVDFQTMPVRGESKFVMSDFYFIFDAVADVNVGGVHEKIVLVDRKETLKKIRPFLFML